ncbi:hypothetical protein PG993_005889 [Apiospora rasikravindrae]|uniref:Rhodopsin domain-containing protein n=1 Tax=Apiospora rasikravindrae TaxID=990691 RepID=A0ABR1TCE9_9PEZI
MFLQVFSVQRHTRDLIYTGLVATFLIYFPSIPLSAIFTAPRVGHSWDELVTNGSPQKLVYWGIVQGSLATVLDIYILILPLPILSKLQLPLRKRLQLAAVFATAILGVLSSIVALYFRVEELHTADLTWNQAGLGMAVVIENNVAIIVASMPAFASFMRNNVLQSQVFKSLQSRLYKGQIKPSGQSLRDRLQGRKVETFGSPRHRVPDHCESANTAPKASQPALSPNFQLERCGSEHEDRCINRTTEIMQRSHGAGDLASDQV